VKTSHYTPDAYGNDQVTLWLRSTENLTAKQTLWINITPINDPPIMYGLPDLIIHYDDPYTFNYAPYVNDIETPRSELILKLFDGFGFEFITIDKLNATFNYPQSKVGETIYATVEVSDGLDQVQDVISIQVTSDYVPELIKKLPDVWLYEGTSKYNVFDLDDYFIDPDNDAIYFSYGHTHVDITINMDHTVDLSASSEWTGSEIVTFRARDPVGAIAEDSILITVFPVNDPPRIEDVPDLFVRHDFDYRFDLTPYIHDKDNTPDELSLITSDQEHIRIDDINHLIIIINFPSEYMGQSVRVRFTVSDGMDQTFQEIMITVTGEFPPRLVQPLPDLIFMEDLNLDDAIDLDDYFIDTDSIIYYTFSGNDFINLTISPDNSVDLSAQLNWFGSETITFRATDKSGAFQEDTILVTVLPINDGPILLPIPLLR